MFSIKGYMMLAQTPFFDEFFDYLVETASPEQVLAFQPSTQAQARATELLNKNSDGTITASEQAELEQFRQYDAMLTKLKLKARLSLQNQQS